MHDILGRCFHIFNIWDRIKAIDDEYSESEIFLKYGLPSLMLYEPTRKEMISLWGDMMIRFQTPKTSIAMQQRVSGERFAIPKRKSVYFGISISII